MEQQRGVWMCQACERPTIRPLSEEEIPTCGQRESLYCPLCGNTQVFQFREMLRDIAHERWVRDRQALCERVNTPSSSVAVGGVVVGSSGGGYGGYYPAPPQMASLSTSQVALLVPVIDNSSQYGSCQPQPSSTVIGSTNDGSRTTERKGEQLVSPNTVINEANSDRGVVHGLVVPPITGGPVGFSDFFSSASRPNVPFNGNMLPLYGNEQTVDTFLREQCQTDESLLRLRDYLTSVVSRIDRTRHERSLCLICLERPKAVIVLPCKHRCLCRECLETLQRSVEVAKECPLCRSPITDTIVPYE